VRRAAVVVLVAGARRERDRVRRPLVDLHLAVGDDGLERLKAAVGRAGGGGLHRGAVHRHSGQVHQPSLAAQRQDLHEQCLQALAVTAQETRDGGMVDLLVAGDDPATHIVEAGRLDLARRADALAVAVQHQSQQHIGWIRRRPLSISAVATQEPGQVQLTDDLEYLPAQMLRRQPPADVVRVRLANRIASDEVVSHKPREDHLPQLSATAACS
jgi:hypothetical protein